MNFDSLSILDTFRISSVENVLLKYHIQRTFEAIQIYKPDASFDQVAKLYTPFQSSPSIAAQKCRMMIDPVQVTVIKSEITPVDLFQSEIRLAFATHHNQMAGRGLQNYKTTDRKYWADNLSLSWPGTDDVIGINSLNQITETSRFNLFLKNENEFFTPTLDSGCVNGCFRRAVLETGFLEINGKKFALSEKNFDHDDLRSFEIYVGNSLRGITKASLANS